MQSYWLDNQEHLCSVVSHNFRIVD